MLDVTAMLEKMKASPYEELIIAAPHTGVVEFAPIKPGDTLSGPSGTWKENPGALLATLTRENNPKNITAVRTGEVVEVFDSLEGKFVEAGEPLVKMRHYLSKDEVLNAILQQALHLFPAPERAKYYFLPNVDAKIRTSGPTSVFVNHGMDLFIMSRMKREVTTSYKGPEGVIYAVYFQPNENVDAGAPLIGVCPPDMLPQIEDVVVRVQTEWEEKA